jgi:hypothetical protein
MSKGTYYNKQTRKIDVAIDEIVVEKKEYYYFKSQSDKLDQIQSASLSVDSGEALSEWFEKKYLVTYDNENTGFYLDEKRIVSYIPTNRYVINCFLPPHLITLIGRFYEGL